MRIGDTKFLVCNLKIRLRDTKIRICDTQLRIISHPKTRLADTSRASRRASRRRRFLKTCLSGVRLPDRTRRYPLHESQKQAMWQGLPCEKEDVNLMVWPCFLQTRCCGARKRANKDTITPLASTLLIILRAGRSRPPVGNGYSEVYIFFGSGNSQE